METSGSGSRDLASSVPDLVIDSKLDVQVVGPDKAVQTVYISNPITRQRRVPVQQTWELQDRLGHGGFGVVWKAYCSSGPDTGSVRAIKQIQKDRARRGNDGLEDYYRELEAYRDFFVRSFGWYETSHDVFITMEYFPLGDLEHNVPGCLPEAEVATIIGQILEAISTMHENNFTHRDLKPGNVLVLQAGPDWWVKLADFGISKRSEGTALRTEVGTPSYLAPEVKGIYPGDSGSEDSDSDSDDGLGNNKTRADQYSSAVDLWSIGAIAFRLLEGKVVFANPKGLCKYVTRRKRFPIPKNCTWGDLPCAEFIQHVMARSAEARPSASEALRHPWLKTREPRQDISSGYEPSLDWTTNSRGGQQPYMGIGQPLQDSLTPPETAMPSARGIPQLEARKYPLLGNNDSHLETSRDYEEKPGDAKPSSSSSAHQPSPAWTTKPAGAPLPPLHLGQPRQDILTPAETANVQSLDMACLSEALAKEGEGLSLQLLQTLDTREDLSDLRRPALSADGRTFAVYAIPHGGDGIPMTLIWTFEEASGRYRRALTHLNRPLVKPSEFCHTQALAVSPDGRKVVCGILGNSVDVLEFGDVVGWKFAKTSPGQSIKGIFLAEFSPSGNGLVVWDSHFAQSWEKDAFGDWEKRASFGDNGHITAMAFSRDGHTIALWRRPRPGGPVISTWNIDKDGRWTSFQQVEASISDIFWSNGFSPDLRFLCQSRGKGGVPGRDTNTYIVATESGSAEMIDDFSKGPNNHVRGGPCFLPDGRSILGITTRDSSNRLRRFSVDNLGHWNEVQSWDEGLGGPNSKILCIARDRGIMVSYDKTEGKECLKVWLLK